MCIELRKTIQSGFTLIELIFFIVIVSVGLAGILLVMDVSVQHSADPLVRKQTVAAAESLLEEILQKQYANPPGGYTGSTRSQFDDVDDYAAYTTSAGMVDITGAAIPGLTQYNVASVTVTTPSPINGVSLKRVVVTVHGPAGDLALTGYRANY